LFTVLKLIGFDIGFGKNAQLSGSRDTYYGKVDRSKNKTKFGDNTQFGDKYDRSKLRFYYAHHCLV